MSKLKYLNGVIFILKWSVLYPIGDEKSISKRIFYYIWSVSFVLSLSVTVIQCAMYLILTPFDLVEESIIIMNTAIYFTLFMNFALFYYKSENLVNLVNNINSKFVDETDNKIDQITMEQSSKLADKMAFYWTLSLVGSTILSAILPLVTGNGELPIPCWFPYDYTQSPLYEISYIWQFICQINLGIIYGCSDMIYPCMTIIIGQQFKILANNFKNNFYTAIVECGIPTRIVIEFRRNNEIFDLSSLTEHCEEVFAVMKLQQFREINLNYFKKNLRHHQMLMDYCEDLNGIMSSFLMTKVVAAFFNIIFIAFTLISYKEETMLLGLCSYVFFASTELLVYTYAGQILTESADFMGTLYESPWYLCDIHYQKLFLILRMRIGKDVYTKAGNYFLMYAPSFLTFMKSIFSYVAVLNELTKTS